MTKMHPTTEVLTTILRQLTAPPRRARTMAAHTIPRAGAVALVDTAIVLAVLGAVILAPEIQGAGGLNEALGIRITLRNALLLAAIAWAWPIVLWAWGLYDVYGVRTPSDERVGVIGACATGVLAAYVLAGLSASGGLDMRAALYVWLGATGLTLLGREIRRGVSSGALGPSTRRVLIVGSGMRALRMWRSIQNDPTDSYALAGFVDTRDSVPINAEVEQHSVGSLDEIESTLMRQAIDDVWVALPVKSHYHQIQQVLHICERLGVRTRYGTDLFQAAVAWPEYHPRGAVTMHVVPHDYRLAIKRAFDIAASAGGLLVLMPLLLGVVLAMKISTPGPILFGQERYGLNRRRFRMFKFRTMVVDAERLQSALETANEADGPVFKIARDPRITPLGRFLRRTSIDELPQLINVLRGDMSLVGPRPLPLRDVERFTRAADMRRFSVRPGLTCLWQVGGRSSVQFDEWIALDLRYIDTWSLRLDIEILVKTVPAVLRGTGAQ